MAHNQAILTKHLNICFFQSLPHCQCGQTFSCHWAFPFLCHLCMEFLIHHPVDSQDPCHLALWLTLSTFPWRSLPQSPTQGGSDSPTTHTTPQLFVYCLSFPLDWKLYNVKNPQPMCMIYPTTFSSPPLHSTGWVSYEVDWSAYTLNWS